MGSNARPAARVDGGRSAIVRPDLQEYLGREVTVTIDRPLGRRHPEHDLRYPVNYGHLPGTTSGDGEAIDAYVLGIAEPVREAVGIVVGVVLRADDVEDKLVVAADGRRYSADEIAALVAFQERYFDSHVEAIARPDKRPTGGDDEMPMAGR